jgi:outer membrane lipoprotein-sorting protein
MKFPATITILAGLLAAACTLAETAEPAAQRAPGVSDGQGAGEREGEDATLSADEILERNFAALGGRERIRAVRTLYLEATLEAGGRSEPLKLYWQRPDRLRIEAPNEGLDTLQVFDGEKAWFTYPALPGFEVQILDGADREALRAQADLVEGPTFDYAAKGHRVELLGRGKLPEGEAWRLLLTTAQGDVRTLWFDAATFLQVREERREFRPNGDVRIESTLSDFRAVGGLLFAHRVESRATADGPAPDPAAGGSGPGRPAEVSVFTIQRLEVDGTVPDALFALPAPTPAPAPPEPSPGPR